MRVLHMLHALEIGPGEIGTTVRNGFKWADAEGQTLSLCVCQHRQSATYECPPEDIVGQGLVREVWVGRFYDIPARLLAHEHELRSREYVGLLASMRHAYGDDFAVSNFVTVLTYVRTK